MIKELSQFIRSKLSALKTTVTFSIPTVISVLGLVAQRVDIVWVTFYLFIIYLIGWNSISILTARNQLSAPEMAKRGAKKAFVQKYPILTRYAWFSLAFSLLLFPFFTYVSPFNHPVDTMLYGTATPTATTTPSPTSTSTATFTPTSTFTLTPTLTPTPKEQAYYYLIVIDASAAMMTEEFDGLSRWDAALYSLNIMLEVLDSRSQFGVVMIGGSEASESNDPCVSRISEGVSFTSKEQAQSQIQGTIPRGGGSYSAAFNLAVSKLQQLPNYTLKTLYFITGPSDACEKRDEWGDIETASAAISSDLVSNIIILDEKSGYKPIEFAKRMQELHAKNMRVNVPTTNSALEKFSRKVVNQTIDIIQAHETAIAPTPQAPTKTFTPRPTNTPENTLTVWPTFTPTTAPTLTFTPSFTPTTPPVCQSVRAQLDTAGFGGTVSINSPSDCTVGIPPEAEFLTAGEYSGIGDKIIWVLAYPPNGLYYPQSPEACASPAPPPNQGGGTWSTKTFIGQKGDPAKWFDIVVIITDQAGSDFLSSHVHDGCQSGTYVGLSENDLTQYNITEKSFITVQTK